MRKILFLIMFLSMALFAESVNAETDMQATNRLMNDCIQNKLCYKANAQSQTVFVYDNAWAMATIDQKQNIGRLFLEYVMLRNSFAQYVDIKSAHSGRKIGEYSSYFGYKEK